MMIFLSKIYQNLITESEDFDQLIDMIIEKWEEMEYIKQQLTIIKDQINSQL